MGSKEKEKQVTVSVTLEIVLTQEDIDDIMCGALEGGITYWCDEAKVVGDYLGEYGSDRKRRKTEITPAGTVRQGRDRVLRAGLGEVQERSRAVGDYTGWLQLLRADGWQDQIRHLQCRRNRV